VQAGRTAAKGDLLSPLNARLAKSHPAGTGLRPCLRFGEPEGDYRLVSVAAAIKAVPPSWIRLLGMPIGQSLTNLVW